MTTKKPLIIFVYGDSLAPYYECSQDLYRLFPHLHEAVEKNLSDMWSTHNDSHWNARVQTKEELEKHLMNFNTNFIETCRLGCFVSWINTYLLKTEMCLKPNYAYGLSLGEVAMSVSLDSKNQQKSKTYLEQIKTSRAFNTYLTGEKEICEKKWKKKGLKWTGYMIYGVDIQEKCRKMIVEQNAEEDVFIVAVNTFESIVIAGENLKCQQVIEQLKKNDKKILCNQIEQPIVAHCSMIVEIKDEIAKIHDVFHTPLENEISCVSLGKNEPCILNKGVPLGKQIYDILSVSADFVKITKYVEKFASNHQQTLWIECGIDSQRSIALKRILNQSPSTSSVVLSMNKNGVNNATQIQDTFEKLMPFVSKTIKTVFESTSNKNATQTRTRLYKNISLGGDYCEDMKMTPVSPPHKKAIFDEKDLLEFAEGKIANVFGSEYAIIDTYPRRVMLPKRDYLLVSRVTEVNATRGVFKPCSMVTEYDLPLNGEFSRGGDIPWAILVESGQCDLMLISYLGIDFQNKGHRVYRLLDTTLTFKDVAHEGETLRYDIHIDSFANQGEKLLFFFHYNCYVKDKLIIEMRGGCAGFFTDKELSEGKGVLYTDKERLEREKLWKARGGMKYENKARFFNKLDMSLLCEKQWEKVFGPVAKGVNVHFTAPKIQMIDQIIHLDPNGGAYGKGFIIGVKFLERDHWYFPCHFRDDQVMAGSLVSEGCSQLLKCFMIWSGLHKNIGTNDFDFRPIYGEGQKVRCRGQILPHKGQLIYVMELFDAGTDPITGAPFRKANINILDIDFEKGESFEMSNLHKYGMGDPKYKIVVDFRNSGLQMIPHKKKIETVSNQLSWHPLAKINGNPTPHFVSSPMMQTPREIQFVPFANGSNPNDQNHLPGVMPLSWYNIAEFAHGKLSQCFGPSFTRYDSNSTASRMPAFELQLVTRILSTKQTQDPKKASMISEFDCPKDAWFYHKNSHKEVMPTSILMEIGLQTSGFLSALTVALRMKHSSPMFRNLDATAEICSTIDLRGKTIRNETSARSFSFMGNMMIHSFHFECFVGSKLIYKGDTSFGWFEPQVFEKQIGLDNGLEKPVKHVGDVVVNLHTFTPNLGKHLTDWLSGLRPHGQRRDPQLEFLDSIYLSEGKVSATKKIDPTDWFFSCHFWLDPVMPGSLGLEAMVQALEIYALHQLADEHPHPTCIRPRKGTTKWKYRGQLVQKNKKMDITLTEIRQQIGQNGDIHWTAKCSLFVDDLRIYEVTDLGITLEFMSKKTLHQNTALLKSLPLVDSEKRQSFVDAYHVKEPLYSGAMAKGIASADLVISMGQAGLLGSFGAGGLPMHLVEEALQKITQQLKKDQSFAVNLIHSPFNENLERGCVELFFKYGVTIVEASAFMNITKHIVRYRVSGLMREKDGQIKVTHRLIGKCSRVELAQMYMAPPSDKLIAQCLKEGWITPEQAEWAKTIPLADDIAVEADSGGHTDNRPAIVILPLVRKLRDRMNPAIRVGLGGGIGCPEAVKAAFVMGADFVVTGTINQMSREAGTCDAVRRMLRNASSTDIAMASAADMMESGVKLQVLKKGNFFPQRANSLYDLYMKYDSLDSIPTDVLEKLEKKVFKRPVAEIWKDTADYYRNILKDDAKADKAERDPKLKMALVFRWYLGLSSRWANTGEKGREMDYQIWAGPCIGSFNDWLDSHPEIDPNKTGVFPSVAHVNLKLMEEAK